MGRQWGEDVNGHRTYAFSAESFWYISSEFLSSAERVSSSAAFLRSRSASCCERGQPMVDGEDIKECRPVCISSEGESSASSARCEVRRK